jgi:ABC-type lipoprotein export system ATPase subunit
MAEVLVNMLTAATLPDSGDVRVFGRSTREIGDADTWLSSLDRYGIITGRAVLLDAMTVEQNLAIPLSLDLHALGAPVLDRVRTLADEVGLGATELATPLAAASSRTRLRLHLARALAPDPHVLLAEHPNALVEPPDALDFARNYARVVATRRIASVVITADRAFAAACGARTLTLAPASGELRPDSMWRRLFG